MNSDPAKRVADLFEPGDVVMLMTMIDGHHSSRPMTVAGVEGERLSFLVDVTADWYDPVEAGRAAVHVTLADGRHNRYAAINGDTRASRDPGEVALLWTAAATAYFDGENDPNLAAVHVSATDGQYWDAPSGRLGTLLALAKVTVTGDPGAAGDQGPIRT